MAEQIVEMCPNCENEVAVWWDIQKDGYQIFCPYCGKPMMLCSMCDRSPCDWKENGCKYSNGQYNDMENDGWVQVEKDIPPKAHKTYLVTYQGQNGRRYVKEAYCNYISQSPKDVYWTKKNSGEVIAWRPLPEPYRPEPAAAQRPEWKDRMLHTFLGGHT